MTTYISEEEVAKIAAVDSIEGSHPTLEELLAEEASPLGLMMMAARVPQPIKTGCDTHYKARHHSGHRPLSAIWWIVLHCTQGATAVGAAQWFTNPASGGSTQLVVDDNICYRCLRDDQIPWGAIGANYHGFHIEQAGFVTWSQAVWSKTHRRTIMRAAFKTALHCKRYGIPVRWCTAAMLRAGQMGITDHKTCVQAFGGSHTDPGPNWPRKLFMTLVRGYMVSIKVRRIA